MNDFPANAIESGKGVGHYFRSMALWAAMAAIMGVSLWFLPTLVQPPHNDFLFDPETAPPKIQEYLSSLTAEQRVTLLKQQRQYLQDEPLKRQTLVNIAILYALSGDTEKSNAVLIRAADRTLRDPDAQTTAMTLSLGRKDYTDAMIRMDGLLRSRPEFYGRFFPSILAIAAVPEGREAVVKVLVKVPLWRPSFMNFAAQQSGQASVYYAVLTAMRERKIEIVEDELRAYLAQLISNKKFEEANFVWLDFLTENELRKSGPIYDGGFEVSPRNLFFDWNVSTLQNVDIGLIKRQGKANERVLQLQFSNYKGQFLGVYQYLRLEPGKYEMSGEASLTSLKTPVGMSWQVSCVGESNIVGQSPEFVTDLPWSTFRFDVVVPSLNCSTQFLTLNWASTATLDQVISGQMLFDDFDMQKIDLESQ
jgi:hypothetical protein